MDQLLTLKYVKGVYRDAEDSWLLQSIVRKFAKGAVVLDIGTGTGIQAITAALAGAKKVLATDINQDAIELAKVNAKINGVKIDVIKSDLFNNVKGKFDLIIFNPPYLPPEGIKDQRWSGGKKLILKFLQEAKNYLTKSGKVVFVFSSQTGLNIKEVKILARKKLFFEEIFVGLLTQQQLELMFSRCS